MKVIFLDIDSVMILGEDVDRDVRTLNPKCVEILNDVWRFTQCEIIISSDWRKTVFGNSLQAARNFFRDANVLAPVVGFTRYYSTYDPDLEGLRTRQIAEWVSTHNPDGWAVLDDLELGEEIREHCILIDREIGLLGSGTADRITSILNS